jgi:hypothetical protein
LELPADRKLSADFRPAMLPRLQEAAFGKDHSFLCLAEYKPGIRPAAAAPVYPSVLAAEAMARMPDYSSAHCLAMPDWMAVERRYCQAYHHWPLVPAGRRQ